MLILGVCRDWRTSWYAVSNWWQMWSGVEFGTLCMSVRDQHSWKGIWWYCVWMATGRSRFDIVLMNRCPFIRSKRELRVSPMSVCLF